MRMARASRNGGYTVVEVMMALAVLAIGSTGVIAMQQTALLGNTNARNLATATAVATTWAERLRTDGMQWTNTNGISNLGATRWLSAASAAPALGPWFAPNEVLGFGSPRADILGADLFVGDPAAQAFCTELRLTSFPVAAGTNAHLIRAEIRVFWSRDSEPVVCGTPNVETLYGRYGFVYVTTAVHQNVL
jgi:prepilin-type N-terminal cleavage/methylation domain-containing protein